LILRVFKTPFIDLKEKGFRVLSKFILEDLVMKFL
jgi:hypothetical protein